MPNLTKAMLFSILTMTILVEYTFANCPRGTKETTQCVRIRTTDDSCSPFFAVIAENGPCDQKCDVDYDITKRGTQNPNVKCTCFGGYSWNEEARKCIMDGKRPKECDDLRCEGNNAVCIKVKKGEEEVGQCRCDVGYVWNGEKCVNYCDPSTAQDKAADISLEIDSFCGLHETNSSSDPNKVMCRVTPLRNSVSCLSSCDEVNFKLNATTGFCDITDQKDFDCARGYKEAQVCVPLTDEQTKEMGGTQPCSPFFSTIAKVSQNGTSCEQSCIVTGQPNDKNSLNVRCTCFDGYRKDEITGKCVINESFKKKIEEGACSCNEEKEICRPTNDGTECVCKVGFVKDKTADECISYCEPSKIDSKGLRKSISDEIDQFCGETEETSLSRCIFNPVRPSVYCMPSCPENSTRNPDTEFCDLETETDSETPHPPDEVTPKPDDEKLIDPKPYEASNKGLIAAVVVLSIALVIAIALGRYCYVKKDTSSDKVQYTSSAGVPVAISPIPQNNNKEMNDDSRPHHDTHV